MEEGKLRNGSRTFLWDGEIIEPMPENLPHINAHENLRILLDARLPRAEWTVNSGKPLALADGYEPQPDITVLRGPRSNYRRQKPTPPDVALLVEVADSIYYDNIGRYRRRYALERVSPCWIVNLHARRIEVYTNPIPEQEAYGSRQDFALGERVPLVLVRDGVETVFDAIDVDDVLRDSPDDPAP
jgi:Uma2 family endonuclease